MTFWCMFWEITIWPKATSPDDDSGGGESTRFIVPPRFNFSPHSSSCPLFSYSTKCFHLLLNCCCCYDAFGFFICEAMLWPVQQKTSTTTTSMLLLAILFWIPFSWKKSMKSASLCRFFMLLFCASLLLQLRLLLQLNQTSLCWLTGHALLWGRCRIPHSRQVGVVGGRAMRFNAKVNCCYNNKFLCIIFFTQMEVGSLQSSASHRWCSSMCRLLGRFFFCATQRANWKLFHWRRHNDVVDDDERDGMAATSTNDDSMKSEWRHKKANK